MTGRRGGRGSATVLERRYRRWLLACPAEYRRERGEELIATLLDLADPSRTRPAAPEVFAVLRLAAAQRIQHLATRCRAPWVPARRGRTALKLGLGWSSLIAVVLFLAPTTMGYSCQSDPFMGGPMVIDCTPRFGFLLAQEPGLWAYLWLLPPLLLSALPVLERAGRPALLAALGLTVFVALTANSLGTYYLPSLVLAWLGTAWRTTPGMPDVVGATGIPELPRGR